jgi:hypothetical protein
VAAPPAPAVAALERVVAGLEKQNAALEKQLVALQTRFDTLQTAHENTTRFVRALAEVLVEKKVLVPDEVRSRMKPAK